MSDAAPRQGRPVEAVARAVAALEALAARGELGVSELARQLGVNASSASRLLGTLESAGLVRRDAGSGRYRLGLRLVHLGNAALAGLDLRAAARPLLAALVESTGETATLSIPDGADGVTIDFVSSPRTVISVARLGRASIGHATAVGKIVLAHRPGEAVRVLAAPLVSYTPDTRIDPSTLADELRDVLAAGLAQASGEREEGLNAIAAPVLDAGGALVAVVGLQGPARFDAEARRLAAPSLRATAAQLSAAVGARPPAGR